MEAQDFLINKIKVDRADFEAGTVINGRYRFKDINFNMEK
jgi:hypothetical protein